jgi:hypothetical protein
MTPASIQELLTHASAAATSQTCALHIVSQGRDTMRVLAYWPDREQFGVSVRAVDGRSATENLLHVIRQAILQLASMRSNNVVLIVDDAQVSRLLRGKHAPRATLSAWSALQRALGHAAAHGVRVHVLDCEQLRALNDDDLRFAATGKGWDLDRDV